MKTIVGIKFKKPGKTYYFDEEGEFLASTDVAYLRVDTSSLKHIDISQMHYLHFLQAHYSSYDNFLFGYIILKFLCGIGYNRIYKLNSNTS